jgi:diguanylate cyclase (GGDEF)-like protein
VAGIVGASAWEIARVVVSLAPEEAGKALARHAGERERLGIAPEEVVAELLALGRLLDRRGDQRARSALDAAVAAYVARVTGELAEQARRDPLTGVLNHAAFHTRVSAETSRARRYGGRLALLLFDVDRFKEVNDRRGHQEGDRLLRRLAAALTGTARESDAVGRVGGDEFAGLLLEADKLRVDAFLARLYDRLPQEFAVSAGVAFFPEEAPTAEELVALADRRLYARKAARAA